MSDGAVVSLFGIMSAMCLAAAGALVRMHTKTETAQIRVDDHDRRIKALEDSNTETTTLLRDQHGMIREILGRLSGVKHERET